MKIFEIVEFQVPTADVERKDFRTSLRLVLVTIAMIIIILTLKF